MAERSGNRSTGWIWILVLLLVIFGVLYLTLSSSRDRITVITARVRREAIVKAVATNGRVEPLLDFQPHAPAPSTVERLDVHLGEQITRGQPLLQLDSSDAQVRIATAQQALITADQNLHNLSAGGTQDELLSQRADVQAAQTQLTTTQNSLRTLQALQSKGAASANEVAAAQGRVDDAQAKLNQLQTREHSRYGHGDFATADAQQREAQQQLASARSDMSGLDIRSPIAGTVYSLPVARFDYVQAGEALLSIADLSKLQIRAFFDEPEIGSLAAGQPVSIVWDAKPSRTWHGHVTQAPTTVTNIGSRSVGECLISVDDADGQLLPNTNVTVRVTTLRRADVLTLPREALRTEGMQNFVYRVIGDKLVRTPVSIGVVTLTQFEVTGGLKPQDQVALNATTDTDLQNGLLVRTQPR